MGYTGNDGATHATILIANPQVTPCTPLDHVDHGKAWAP